MNIGDIVLRGKWIDFIYLSQKPKTSVYQIINRENKDILGHIYWHSPWRQYSFMPEPNIIFEKTCLQDIANFLVELKNQRAALKRKDKE